MAFQGDNREDHDLILLIKILHNWRRAKKSDTPDGIPYSGSNDAFWHNLGDLYIDQGKMAEAEKMYQRALEGCEKA